MSNRNEIIERLENLAKHAVHYVGEPPFIMSLDDGIALHDAVAILKAQEPRTMTLEELADAYGLTAEGVQFALEQYQTVICEITHGRMSKLSYFADDILRVADEVKCAGCELQEPRVMTLEEVNALDWDYCYLEQERLPGKEYRGMLGKHIMTCVTWPSITAAKISQGKDNYGKTWRCWTSRPDKKTMEATSWE